MRRNRNSQSKLMCLPHLSKLLCLIAFCLAAARPASAAEMPLELRGNYNFGGLGCDSGSYLITKWGLSGFFEGGGGCTVIKIKGIVQVGDGATWKGRFRCSWDGAEWESVVILSLIKKREPALLVSVHDLSGSWASRQWVNVAESCRR